MGGQREEKDHRQHRSLGDDQAAGGGEEAAEGRSGERCASTPRRHRGLCLGQTSLLPNLQPFLSGIWWVYLFIVLDHTQCPGQHLVEASSECASPGWVRAPP